MISRPENGWAEITLGGHRLPVSYIQPVPEMLLTAFIRALSTGSAADVTFDAEGSTWRMVAGTETRLTTWDSGPQDIVVPVSLPELARRALADIRRDMDAWCRWNPAEPADVQRATLTRLCARLEELIPLRGRWPGISEVR